MDAIYQAINVPSFRNFTVACFGLFLHDILSACMLCSFQLLSNPESPINPNPLSVPDSFDFLGQEMADLQQLLVSMVTGKGFY